MKKRSYKYRFHFPLPVSPTNVNLLNHLTQLGWNSTKFESIAHFGKQNFEFNTTVASNLEFKDLLAELLLPFYPEIMPETYSIHDENWGNVLNYIADQYYWKNNYLHNEIEDLIWILKPALVNNGQHIRIFRKLEEIEAHYLKSNRLGGRHVLQRYINQPHLLEGKKYSIRMFVILTNYAGVYLYPHGYLNLALFPYQLNNIDLRIHLTNEHLLESTSNVLQIPTYHSRAFFDSHYQQIRSIISLTYGVLKQKFPNAFICKKIRKLAIFGFDFMVDSQHKVWLLEANHGPCFPTEDTHILQKDLYRNFWQAFIKSFVLPIAVHQPINVIQYDTFEYLCD